MEILNGQFGLGRDHAFSKRRVWLAIFVMESEGGFREYISTIFPLLKVESTLVNAAQELYSNGLITGDTHRDVTTQHNQPTHQRVSSLITAVNATIRAFPKKEQNVLKILDTNNYKVFPFHNQVTLSSCSQGQTIHVKESNMRSLSRYTI